MTEEKKIEENINQVSEALNEEPENDKKMKQGKAKSSKKDKAKEKEELSKEDKKIAAAIKKEIVIHSMPKRFFKTVPVAKQSKGVGVLIIAGGGLVLIATIALVYFFVFKKDPSAEIEEPEVVFEEEAAEGAEDSKVNEEEQAAASVKPDPEKVENVEVVQNENTEENMATSSEENAAKQATTTKKTVSAENINEELQPVSLKKAADSDNDGLLDKEEEIFSTETTVRDSDGDGYDDLAEILNKYNPAGNGSLMVNDGIEKYLNSQYGYYFYYPKNWEIDNIDGNTSVLFKAPNNQFVQIIIQANTKNQSLEEWYKDQFGVIRVEQAQKRYKKGWLAIKSADALSTYLMSSNSSDIYVITYSIGIDNVLYYENIYNMIINTLEVSD